MKLLFKMDIKRFTHRTHIMVKYIGLKYLALLTKT